MQYNISESTELTDSSEAQRHPFRKTAISNFMPRYWFLFRWFYPSLDFKLWQSTTNFEAEHKKWINKENQVVHLWQKWQMFAVCWVSPLMDSSAAALFVASTKTQKLHDASSCICRICASSIILDFKKPQLVFHPQYLKLVVFQAKLHGGDWELRVHSLRRRHVLAGGAGGGGGGNNHLTFLCSCLCFCFGHPSESWEVVRVNHLLFCVYRTKRISRWWGRSVGNWSNLYHSG